MTWPTTRRHPRTLAEAFPDVRAACVELPRKRITTGAADIALAVAIGVAIACVLVSWFAS